MLKTKKQTTNAKKHVAVASARNALMAKAHLQRLPGTASPAYIALELCYLSRYKLGFLAGQRACSNRNFPSGVIAANW
jgi:hypothetical protein